MDGAPLAGLSPASIRMVAADWGTTPSQAVKHADPAQAAPDYIELSSAITPPDSLEKLLLHVQTPEDLGAIAPSLASLMEAIQRYLQEALERAKIEDETFYRRIEALADHLATIRGSDRLKAIGQLIGATSPDLKDEFYKAAKALADKTQEFSEGSTNRGDMELKVTDLRLSVSSGSPSSAHIKFESVQLSLHAGSSPQDQPIVAARIGRHVDNV